MQHLLQSPPTSTFFDRRGQEATPRNVTQERRQFVDCYESLSPEAQELATAIDGYKLRHRRRFITYEEMLSVIQSLGYRKS